MSSHRAFAVPRHEENLFHAAVVGDVGRLKELLEAETYTTDARGLASEIATAGGHFEAADVILLKELKIAS